MKVLFAVNNESVSESIVKKYQKDFKEIISYKNVYYFNAIIKEMQRDKTYDRIVISEDLEPFANNSEWGTITNDLDPQYDTMYHMEATDFLKMLDDKCADVVLYDPPFSVRQLSESYKKFGLSVNSETTRSDYWTK